MLVFFMNVIYNLLMPNVFVILWFKTNPLVQFAMTLLSALEIIVHTIYSRPGSEINTYLFMYTFITEGII